MTRSQQEGHSPESPEKLPATPAKEKGNSRERMEAPIKETTSNAHTAQVRDQGVLPRVEIDADEHGNLLAAGGV